MAEKDETIRRFGNFYKRIWNCKEVNYDGLVTIHIAHIRKKLKRTLNIRSISEQ